MFFICFQISNFKANNQGQPIKAIVCLVCLLIRASNSLKLQSNSDYLKFDRLFSFLGKNDPNQIQKPYQDIAMS